MRSLLLRSFVLLLVAALVVPSSGHTMPNLRDFPETGFRVDGPFLQFWQRNGGYFYLSIGSSCDVCEEHDPLRATVARFRPDGSELELFASGLRNSVGIAFHPDSGALWGADMGRNNLGPELPPEEFNLLERGHDYSWPYCYGNCIPNPEFADPLRCARTVAPRYLFPAHWAPLGVAFYDQAGFPASYRGDTLIAFHGSAPDQISCERRGYRVVRLRFKNGEPVGREDLLRGFVSNGEVWGRPAGLLVAPDGSLLVSDDHGGRIFRVVADAPQ